MRQRKEKTTVPLTPEQSAQLWENRGLAYAMANKLWKSNPRIRVGKTRDDLDQQALVYLAEVITEGRHDPAKQKFTTFACFVIIRRLRAWALYENLIRVPAGSVSKNQAAYAEPYEKSLKLKTIGNIPLLAHSVGEEEIANKLDVQYALRYLTNREREMVDYYFFQCMETVDISKHVGISRSAILETIRRAKGKIGRLLGR